MATASIATPAMIAPIPDAMSAFDSAMDMPSCTLSTFTAAAHASFAFVTMFIRNALVWCSVVATCCIPMVIAMRDCTRACILASSSFLALNTPITPAAALMAPVMPLMPLARPAAKLPPVLSCLLSAVVVRMMVASSPSFCFSFSYSAVFACPASLIRRSCSVTRSCSVRNDTVAGAALLSCASSSAMMFFSSASALLAEEISLCRLSVGAPGAILPNILFIATISASMCFTALRLSASCSLSFLVAAALASPTPAMLAFTSSSLPL